MQTGLVIKPRLTLCVQHLPRLARFTPTPSRLQPITCCIAAPVTTSKAYPGSSLHTSIPPAHTIRFISAVVAAANVLSLGVARIEASINRLLLCTGFVDVKAALKVLTSRSSLRLLSVAAARVIPGESLSGIYARTFEKAAFGFAKVYLFCLFMRVLLSWFPGIDWNAQPWTFLRLITEPYLQIYRGLVPPLFGQLDFTPLFGFLILQDVVQVMAPSYTLGMHARDTSTEWTTSDVLGYFNGF